ncbi:hypothetical protein, partial [Nocardia gipuzkoensis]
MIERLAAGDAGVEIAGRDEEAPAGQPGPPDSGRSCQTDDRVVTRRWPFDHGIRVWAVGGWLVLLLRMLAVGWSGSLIFDLVW